MSTVERAFASEPDTIRVVDYGLGTTEYRLASEFPESIRMKPSRRNVDGKEVVVQVKVKEVHIRPIDHSGNLVADKSKIILINIQYFDDQGKLLQSTTMRKDPPKRKAPDSTNYNLR